MQHFEQLVEMEILFNSFDEFASLEGCTNLKRLSCKLFQLCIQRYSLRQLILCSSMLPRYRQRVKENIKLATSGDVAHFALLM